MIDAQIVPATASHIEEMLPNVRQADIDEFLAASGWDARRVLELNDPKHPWLTGHWPKYPWMIRKLNPFAGEKSASTGQSNSEMAN